MGPGRSGGVLCHSPVLPLSQHPLSGGVEHGGGRQGHRVPAPVAAQHTGKHTYTHILWSVKMFNFIMYSCKHCQMYVLTVLLLILILPGPGPPFPSPHSGYPPGQDLILPCPGCQREVQGQDKEPLWQGWLSPPLSVRHNDRGCGLPCCHGDGFFLWTG